MIKKIIILIGFIGIGLISANKFMAKTEIKVGDKLPAFTLKDQHGKDFTATDYVGKKALVIYFYPKDDTPGCTKEACAFRDEFEVFTDLNALVIGISSDDVASHKKFAEKYKLPFTLLADTKKEVRKLFGVPKFMGAIAGRVTYIFNKKGEVIYIFNSMRKAVKHIEEAKKILESQKE